MKISAPVFLLLLICSFVRAETEAAEPYPHSKFIAGVEWDWATKRVLAPGSDNWPITWADDGYQYTCWGDGGGFGGTNSLGRVSLGFARIEGNWDDYRGVNLWGGHQSLSPAVFGGKSYGLICVKGILYAWLGQDGKDSGSEQFIKQTSIITSSDHGLSWHKSGLFWTIEDSLYGPSFLNFGRDNSGARDRYVYSYFPRGSEWQLQQPGRADLARVAADSITSPEAYQWFAGLDKNGRPRWTEERKARKPVFEDANGLRTVSVTYDPALKRYLLTSQHSKVGTGPGTNQWGIFESEEPWGPWRTVFYSRGWGREKGIISFYFAPGWFSDDGLGFSLVYTADDHWGTLRGRFVEQPE